MLPTSPALAERSLRANDEFIMQLSHSGHQQDMGGVENLYKKAQSATSTRDYFHGILCQSMNWKLFGNGAVVLPAVRPRLNLRAARTREMTSSGSAHSSRRYSTLIWPEWLSPEAEFAVPTLPWEFSRG